MFTDKTVYEPLETETFAFFGRPAVKKHVNPVQQFYLDLGNLVTHAGLSFVALSPFRTDRSIDELYLMGSTVFSLIWFGVFSLVQMPAVLILLLSFIIIAAIIYGLTISQNFLIWRLIQGPQLQVYPPEPPKGYNSRHRWVYINGIATGSTITRQNIECLSQTFHNPILAINNRTYGFMGDLLECVIQRSFGFHTKETGITYDIIRGYLEDYTNVDKVIFIAHSQGGIIAAQVLDQLYSSVSQDELRRLEVYTFGSAALQFNNPFKDKTQTDRIVPVMEHYCNERDMVTSWGALSSADRVEIPFQGRVFVFVGETGHMLNQHYLKYMFTGPPYTWQSDNFQLRAANRDSQNAEKFYVGSRRADTSAGEKSVQDLSSLWRYM